MSEDLIPFPILANPPLNADDWGRIRAAKAALDLPFQVKPVPAVPGSPMRILAIGIKPQWAHEGAYVESTTSPGFAAAVRYVLTGEDDPRGMTIEKWLQGILGPGVKEVPDDTEPTESDTDYGNRGRIDPNANGWGRVDKSGVKFI